MTIDPTTYRRTIPMIITFTLTIVTIFSYFFVVKEVSNVINELLVWVVVITSFALILGILSTLRFHVGRIYKGLSKRTFEMFYSIIALITFLIFFGIGLILTTAHPSYQYMFNYVVIPIREATSACVALFLISATVRALVARSVETVLFLVSAILIMLMNAPIGEAIWPGLPVLGKWIMDIPNTASNRGILLTYAIGVVALGIRKLLGYEERVEVAGA